MQNQIVRHRISEMKLFPDQFVIKTVKFFFHGPEACFFNIGLNKIHGFIIF